jgi:hypothetical protein
MAESTSTQRIPKTKVLKPTPEPDTQIPNLSSLTTTPMLIVEPNVKVIDRQLLAEAPALPGWTATCTEWEEYRKKETEWRHKLQQ